MTKLSYDDIVRYIYKIQLNFENAYITENDFQRQLLAESWYEALCEYPKEICDKAVNNALKKAKFAPRLGDITAEIENILNIDSKSDEELWAELADVLPKVYEISRYIPYPHYTAWAQAKINEIFNSLDQAIKAYVVNTSSLVLLSEQTIDELKFEKARFFKQAPSLKKRVIEQNKSQLFLEKLSKLSLPDSKKN